MTYSDQRFQGGSLALRVAEALPKDVGRGVVRLDPHDLSQLGVAIGDVVQIGAKRTTVARATPAYTDQRGQALVQMDGILRANAGAGLDERVTVQRVAVQPARSLVLEPATPIRNASGSGYGGYLARLLNGIPVVAGDQVRATLMGTETQSFTVVETVPSGPVLIDPTTTIRLSIKDKETTAQRDTITYDDIGGLRREVRRIREMIEMPLRFPEVFERLGIAPPKGVLLHGPPGCGKTLIARAVAQETSARFFHVAGPEIIDQWYGASEAHLRKIFEDAKRRAPAIIFLDEIDAIAPKREGLSGERQAERRLVAQLLTLMDGLKPRGNVIVIAATNIPDTLDPALRRPGRFDREITIGVPDAAGRREILEICTRGMPLGDDVDLAEVATHTHGFVGADLEALSREAAMRSLRRVMPGFDIGEEPLSYGQLMALRVTAADFAAAQHDISPSALREVFTELPEVSWSDIGGLDEVKRLLVETVEWPLRYGSVFTSMGIKPARGVLLHGPPGTGKTLLAKALAHESAANFVAVKGPQLLSMYVGETERAIRDVFRKARQAAPCILFFDEIDSLAPVRGSGDQQTSERVVAQLLTEIDGIEETQGLLVVAATNRVDRVDPALLRPGRFDQLVALPLPDLASREAIFAVHTRKMPLAPDVDVTQLAAASDECSGADIDAICRRAAILAMRDQLDRNALHASGSPDLTLDVSTIQVRNEHFQDALDELMEQRYSGLGE